MSQVNKELTKWMNAQFQLSTIDRHLILNCCDKFLYKPKISIITPVYNTNLKWLKECAASVKNQLYKNYEWCICDNGTINEKTLAFLKELEKDSHVRIIRVEKNIGIVNGTNLVIDMATGDYSILLDSDDLLYETSLYYIVNAVNTNPNIKFAYTDEAFVEDDDTAGYIDVFFKPDWSPDFLRSRNYIDHLKIFKTDFLKELKLREGYEGSHDYDLLLRMAENCKREEIYHIQTVCYVWRQHSSSNSQSNVSYPIMGAIKALEEHLGRIGKKGQVMWEWPWYRVKYETPVPAPKVGVLVCSINKNGLLFRFITNILSKTLYSNYVLYLCVPPTVREKMIILFRYFIDVGRIKFVDRTEDEPYNFSLFNNRMVEACEEDYICQMNDDVEPITGDWLDELVSIGIQDHVGAVGPKLVYQNMDIQHVGCVLGIGGVCEHVFKHQPNSNPGYHGRAKIISNVSMVTAACVLMKKKIYKELGGDDENLALAFNDVDFCIRVRDAGYYNIINPYSLLIHHESTTRGLPDTEEKRKVENREGQYMLTKWKQVLRNDPFYNPNLTLRDVNYSLDSNPRFKKPWIG